MTPKQLANVLIKILGLSMCVYWVPTSIYTILSTIDVYRSYSQPMTGNWTPLVHSLVPVAIGVWLILYSQQITGWLFKKEEP